MRRWIYHILTSSLFLCCVSVTAFGQTSHFSQLGWQKARYLPAAAGIDGGGLQFMARQSDSLYSVFWGANLQIDKLNSAIGFHQQIEQTFGTSYRLRNAVHYAGYVRLPKARTLRMGIQGIQQSNGALATELQGSDYWTNISLAYSQEEVVLGLQLENALNTQGETIPSPNINFFAGFDELLTTRWWQSSMYLIGDFKADGLAPEWKYQYTATFFNTLLLGGSLYRNSPEYSWGLNGGIKLFRRAWLTASADFPSLEMPTEAPVHLQAGLRFRFKPTQKVRERLEKAQEPTQEDLLTD